MQKRDKKIKVRKVDFEQALHLCLERAKKNRNRKKEYIEMLENRIRELEEENLKMKREQNKN